MNKIIYTANFGGYDVGTPLDKGLLAGGWKAVYLADGPKCPPGWDYHCDSGKLDPSLPNVAKARLFKICPWHVLGDDWDTCVWVDANVLWQEPLSSFVNKITHDFATLERNDHLPSLHGELRNLASRPTRSYLKGDRAKESLRDQLKSYISQGVPDVDGNGVCTRILVRRNTPEIRELCDRWWNEMLLWKNWRDQPCLRKVLWEGDYDPGKLDYTRIRFLLSRHSNHKPKSYRRMTYLSPLK